MDLVWQILGIGAAMGYILVMCLVLPMAIAIPFAILAANLSERYVRRKNQKSIDTIGMLWCDSGVILQRRSNGNLVAWQEKATMPPRTERPCMMELIAMVRTMERREPTSSERNYFNEQLVPWQWTFWRRNSRAVA